MIDPQAISCYAVRRLNPFLGVVQILETPGGRASTTNGVVWQLELPATKPQAWGSLNTATEEWGWYFHGLWSEKEGLVTSPLVSGGTDREESAACRYLIEQLKTVTAKLPFPLRDDKELWLLDEAEKKPLALLFSMPGEAGTPCRQPRHWCGSLGREDLGGQRRFPETGRLEAEVRKRAGFNPSTLWVSRDAARSGTYTADGSLIGREALPIYGIREDWSNEQNTALVERYIDWIAPSLLTLPYLGDQERGRLESRLQQQAISIEYHWRLYPKILDKEKIVAARVQARLQSDESKRIVE